MTCVRVNAYDIYVISATSKTAVFFPADLAATWHLIGETVERDGEKYMHIKRYIPTYTVGDMKAYAENLVDSAPELSKCGVLIL